MATSRATFSYPPLPKDADAICIISIEAGDFYDALVCTIKTVTFSEKPNYVALSYTWGVSYPENAKLSTSPNGTIEHASVAAARSENLLSPSSLAFRDLETEMTNHINSDDLEERNCQVALMSFIYMRAANVVVWLGTKDYSDQSDSFSCMAIDWKAGQTQHVAASLSDEQETRRSATSNADTYVRLVESSYWTRLWVVQEACLPQHLIVAYGASILRYEDFQQYAPMAHKAKPMSRPLDARNMRYSSMMTLEALIERFAENSCVDSRDKVYGLLGLANDIRPFSAKDNSIDPTQAYLESLDLTSVNLPEPDRGAGFIQVDYSRSHYDIWCDVIKFVLFRARTMQTRFDGRQEPEALVQPLETRLTTSQKAIILEHERLISVVRTASVVLNALGRNLEHELAHRQLLQMPRGPEIRAIGYIRSNIMHIGPKYGSLIASFQAQQEWVHVWGDHYRQPAELECLRKLDEEYISKIMTYDKADLAGIAEIRDASTVAWCGSARGWARMPGVEDYEKLWQCVDKERPAQPHDPSIYLGTDQVIGLVPPAAEVGDVIVKFWNCTVAIVLRPWRLPDNPNHIDFYLLVGRADVADDGNHRNSFGRDIYAEQGFFSGDGHRGYEGLYGAVHVNLTFQTLQLLTTSIDT
ncbi:MAG: hypothetical protein M1821_000675 [Bathelium mastoideum]|nr:MAG: hypothetical protein M1821_000675 [Bathelium mastoideum]